MLDVLSEIYRQRGQAAPDRRGADRSVHTVGYLIDPPDPVTYLCTVSVFDSEPISGVPATSMDYTDITAVHVLLDPFTGRPVHVLGPAGELPFGEVPFARDTRHVVTGHIVPPTSTGTYREDEAAWDRYSTMTFGGVADVWQQAGAAVNLTPNPEPTTTTGWSSSWGGMDTLDDQTWPASSPVEASFLTDKYGGGSGYIYPTPGGTSAVEVSASTSYDIEVMVLIAPGSSPAESVAVGAVWFDASGAELSSTTGTAVPIDTTVEETGWIELGDPMVNQMARKPTVTVTAPAGAAFARPFLLINNFSTYATYVWVGMFQMFAA